MPTKRITIPEPVVLTTRDGERVKDAKTGEPIEPIPFAEVVDRLLYNSKAFANVPRAAAAIQRKVWPAKPGDVIELAEEDWKPLRQAAEEEPECTGWPRFVLFQLVPHLDAICEPPAVERALPSNGATAASSS